MDVMDLFLGISGYGSGHSVAFLGVGSTEFTAACSNFIPESLEAAI